MEFQKCRWFRLAVVLILNGIRMPKVASKIRPYPKLHNFVADLVAEGRRKNIVQIVFEADFSSIRRRMTEYQNRTDESITVTTYIAKCFACAVARDKLLQAYRKGKSRLVVFDDIDLTFIIEREWEGNKLPVFHIVRAAQRKSLQEIHHELREAKEALLGADGPMRAFILQFFLLPGVVRKFGWFLLRNNPYWFKAMAGTVGVTSVGMHASGALVMLPITPMTLTLCIGGVEKKVVCQSGEFVERDVIHLNLSLDHEVVDGAPAVHLIERFKDMLQRGADDFGSPE